MKIKLKNRDITYTGFIILLFSFSVNLGGFVVLWRILIASLTTSMLLLKKRMPKRTVFLILVLTMWLYLLFSTKKVDAFGILRYGICPGLFFLAGYFLAFDNQDNEMKAINIIVFLMLGYTIYQGLNFSVSSSLLSISRNTYDYWNGEVLHPTNFNSKGLFAVAFAPPLFFRAKGIVQKVLLMILIAFICYASISTASRTNLWLLVLNFTTIFLYDFAFCRNEMKQRMRRKKVLFSTMIILFILVFIAIRYWNTIVNWYVYSALSNRLSTNDARLSFSGDGRWTLWKETIVLLFNNPRGDASAFYAHNIILDTGRVSGIIPMLLMVCYIGSCFKTMIIFLKLQYSHENKKIVLSSFIVFFVAFMIEPILESRPYEFLGSVFLMGMLSALNRIGIIEWKREIRTKECI